MNTNRSDVAQVQMLEVVIAVLIIIVSFLFVYNSLSSPKSTVMRNPMTQLREIGDDALSSLYESSPTVPKYDNLLIQYVLENDTSDISRYLNNTLPNTVSYNIWISYSGGGYYLFYSKDKEETPHSGNVARAHRVVDFHGKIYDVQLEVWYV